MGKLTYGMMMSIDGFLADASSYFDDGVLGFINDEMRSYGTEIYGRRMYEEMVYWETYEGKKEGSGHADEFARLWKGFDKLVISTTLERVSSGNTELVRAFDPEEIRRLKIASAKDISVSGPTLAAQFIKAGLVDEYGLYIVPVVLGAGKPVFREIETRLDLDLIEERRFASGMIFLRYVSRDKGE